MRTGLRAAVRSLPAIVLALGGCAAAPGPSPAPSPATEDSTRLPAISPESTGASSSMSQEELTRSLQQAPPGPPRSNAEALQQYWEQAGLDGEPPAVQPVRTVDTAEWNTTIQPECMAEQGFPTTEDQHGQAGISFDLSQEDDLKRATYICMAKYPLDEKYLRPYSLSQLRILYDWRVEHTIPCMKSDGVSPPEPPSFETFVAEYAATGYKHWSPHTEVEVPPEAQVTLGESTWCPDTPPEDVLYADK